MAHRRLSGFLHCSRLRPLVQFRLPPTAIFMYAAPRAVVAVEAQPFDNHVAETATMIITGILFTILGVGLLCWLLFALAVQALPLFIGAAVGALLTQNGASVMLAIAVGLVSAVLASRITQFLCVATKSSHVRAAITLLLTAPAAFAGYHATLGITRIALFAGGLRELVALIGAFVVGSVAFARLNAASRRSAKA
jgi:hypothetical protein